MTTTTIYLCKFLFSIDTLQRRGVIGIARSYIDGIQLLLLGRLIFRFEKQRIFTNTTSNPFISYESIHNMRRFGISKTAPRFGFQRISSQNQDSG